MAPFPLPKLLVLWWLVVPCMLLALLPVLVILVIMAVIIMVASMGRNSIFRPLMVEPSNAVNCPSQEQLCDFSPELVPWWAEKGTVPVVTAAFFHSIVALSYASSLQLKILLQNSQQLLESTRSTGATSGWALWTWTSWTTQEVEQLAGASKLKQRWQQTSGEAKQVKQGALGC